MKQRILDYNAVLATHVSTFAVNNPDVNVLTFDAHAWFGKVLDAPGAFGFRNVTGYVRVPAQTRASLMYCFGLSY